MTSRRTMLAGAVGIAFCSCGLLKAAHAQGQPTPRQAVTVNGRRVKTIDVHAHCVFPDSAAQLGPEGGPPPATTRGNDETTIDLAQRLRAMDSQKVDMEVLSVNPYWYGKPRELASQIVRINNEKMAEFCAANSERFAGFASLTLQAPELAVRELETAMRRQGLKGAAIGGSVAGVDFSDPRFHPVWAKAEELGATLFIHPAGVPQLSHRLAGNGWLANAIGNPLDTTIALSHLIFEGTLDRFPGLRILAAHGGGYLGGYGERSDHACFVNPPECNPAITLQKKPSEYLKQIWFDSLVFTPEAIRHLAAQVGPGQIMLGSDYPFPWALEPVDHIFACDSLSDEQKLDVLGMTAAKVLNIPV